MLEPVFQQLVISEVQKLNGRFDTLEGKVDAVTSELREFKESQQQYNERMEEKTNALWDLSNQAFSAIADMSRKADDIHQEAVSPWKRRQAKIF